MSKTKKATKKNRLEKAKSVVKKINNDLIDASFDAIETSVKAGKKWQKLTSKLIKKSEPLTKKQMGMFVETADNLKKQADFGLTRLKALVGYKDSMLEDAKKMVSENPIVQKAEKMVTKLKKEVSENPLVQKAEELTNTIKKEAIETYEEIVETIEEIKDKDKKSGKATPKKKVLTEKKKVVAKKTIKKVSKVKKGDNLKVIKGIGPKMAQILIDNGISTYEKLVAIDIKDLNEILTNTDVNLKRYNPSEWKIAAIELLKDKK